MTLRTPRRLAQAAKSDADVLAYEILQEQAAVLARLGRRLEAALAELAAYDGGHQTPAPRQDPERERLVDAAGEALWYFVVQREVLGIRDAEVVLRELRVPREVRLRMGLPRRRAGDAG